jgi:hypothetical protein
MRGIARKAAARITRRLLLVLALTAPQAAVAQQAQPRFIPQDENPEDYPAGAGREDAFYNCTACHGFKLIAQQGMNRRQWEDSINLMVSKHNMPPLDAKTRDSVLSYLEATYPPRTQRGWQNPFLGR